MRKSRYLSAHLQKWGVWSWSLLLQIGEECSESPTVALLKNIKRTEVTSYWEIHVQFLSASVQAGSSINCSFTNQVIQPWVRRDFCREWFTGGKTTFLMRTCPTANAIFMRVTCYVLKYFYHLYKTEHEIFRCKPAPYHPTHFSCRSWSTDVHVDYKTKELLSSFNHPPKWVI